MVCTNKLNSDLMSTNNEIIFTYSSLGWEQAKEWALTQSSPSGVQSNLWEWAESKGNDSVEVLMLVNNAKRKDVNNSES